MYKEAILENENRRRIYSLINTHQGIHLRELQRLLDVPLATLEYHLSYMSRKKIIYGEKADQFRRYYTKPLDPQDKKILTILRQKKMREIVLSVVSMEQARYQLIAENLKLPCSTLSFYLKYLVDKGVLEREKIGYETFYRVRDEERVAKVLIAYKASLFDKLIDKALNTWLESYSAKDEL
jgi:predicted transcriptional regulator